MSELSFNLTNRIKLTNPNSNIDIDYGPYISIEDACLGVLKVIRDKGKTVGIIESGTINEYWWKSGIEDSDLVLKTLEIDYIKGDKGDKGDTGVSGLSSSPLDLIYIDTNSFVLPDNYVVVSVYENIGLREELTYIIEGNVITIDGVFSLGDKINIRGVIAIGEFTNAFNIQKDNKIIYDYNTNIVLPTISSINYERFEITFTEPHSIATLPHFYSHSMLPVHNISVKANPKVIPSGLFNLGSCKIIEIVSETTLRFGNLVNGSVTSLPNIEGSQVDLSKFHFEIASGLIIIPIPACKTVKVTAFLKCQMGQPYFDFYGNETGKDNTAEVGTILGMGESIIERTATLINGGIVFTRTTGDGFALRETGYIKYSYSTTNSWRRDNCTELNTFTISTSYPMIANGSKFIIEVIERI